MSFKHSLRIIRPVACLLILTQWSGGQTITTDASTLKVEGRVAFTEGPAWHPNGNVFFSDIANNRIMRRDPSGQMHVFRTESGRTNGLLIDREGRLICCEGGGPEGNRRVTRIENNGTISVLVQPL